MRPLRVLVPALLAAALFQGLPPPARAALGGDAASVEADRASLKGQVRPGPGTGAYQVEEITLPSGTVLREYLAAGRVFAVTWRGPAMPDLGQILGVHFQRYTAAAAAPVIRHRLVAVDDPDLVVRASGHMRAFTGRALIPSLFPPGVGADDIH